MQVKISKAVRMITAAIKAKVVPIIHGSPGIGKSQIVYQIAAAYNLLVIDFRLSQCDPTDLSGFPTITGLKADYVPMKHFPIEGDPIPAGYSGWLLFFDEATSAMPAVQAAAYKVVLDRMVGSYKIHKQCAMVMAGNMMSDGAIVHEMSTALQSRLLHLELICDAAEWDEWAVANNIDFRITSYIKFKSNMIYTFSADHTDSTYACPRTWEFTNRLLGIMDPTDKDMLELLAGTISEGVAREFLGFCKIHADLLKPAQILADPEKVRMPTEPSVLFALSGSIANNISMDNGEAYMKFVSRLPVEFQVVCLRETIRRNKAMLAHKAVQEWIVESGKALF